MAQLAPPDIEVNLHDGLGELPLFNPDLEGDYPATVLSFHRAIAESDALIIASPEYAHGVTGTIKNALDWLVGFEPFAAKMVAVLNTSARAQHADAALRETLNAMATIIVESASITIPLLGAGLDEAGMLASPEVAGSIRDTLSALAQAVRARQTPAAVKFPLD